MKRLEYFHKMTEIINQTVKNFGHPIVKNGQLCDIKIIYQGICQLTEKEDCLCNLSSDAISSESTDLNMLTNLLANDRILSLRMRFINTRKVFNLESESIIRLLYQIHDAIAKRYARFGKNFIIIINDVVGYEDGVYTPYGHPCSQMVHQNIVLRMKNIEYESIFYPPNTDYVLNKRTLKFLYLTNIVHLFIYLPRNDHIRVISVKDEITKKTEEKFVKLCYKIDQIYTNLVSIDIMFSIKNIFLLLKYFPSIINWQTYETKEKISEIYEEIEYSKENESNKYLTFVCPRRQS